MNLIISKATRDQIVAYLSTVPSTPLVGRNISNIIDYLSGLKEEQVPTNEKQSDPEVETINISSEEVKPTN